MIQPIDLLFGVQTAYAQSNSSDNTSQIPTIFTYILEKFPLWLGGLVIFLIFLGIAYIMKSWVENHLSNYVEKEHPEAMIISGRLSFLFSVLIGATIALSIAGIDLTGLLAALAFGISFGLQDTIANFVAGLGILASRPFKIGDWVKVDGMYGKVEEIRTRATYLKDSDGQRLIVPNAVIYKASLTSTTTNPTRRIRIPIYCRYGMDNIKEVTKIALKVVKKHSKILLEPKPSVVITDLADYYIELTLRVYIVSGTSWFKLKSKIFGEVHKLLEEAGLDAPYPVTSLSTEEDIETGIFKAQLLDKQEVVNLLDERQKYHDELNKRKKEILSKQLIPTLKKNVDLTGINFLQKVELERAAPNIMPQQQPPSEPQPYIAPQTTVAPEQVQAVPPQAAAPIAPVQEAQTPPSTGV